MSADTGRAASPHEGAPSRRDRRAIALRVALLLLSVGFVATEVCLVLPGHLLAAQLVDAGLVLALANLGLSGGAGLSPRGVAARAALIALALVPLIRVFTLGLPAQDLSRAANLLLVAVLIGAAAARMAPAVGIDLGALLRPRLSAAHTLAIGGGLLLGGVAYLAGAPALWPRDAATGDIALAIAAVTCAAVAEELVFRGIVQVTLQRAIGATGAIIASALFAMTYLDVGTTELVLVYALAGFVFARSVARSASLAGAVIGHVLLAVGAGAAWPVAFGRVPPFDLPDPLTSVLLTIAIAIAASAAGEASRVGALDAGAVGAQA